MVSFFSVVPGSGQTVPTLHGTHVGSTSGREALTLSKCPGSQMHWSTEVDAGGETDFLGQRRHAVPIDWDTLGLYVFSVQLTTSLH